MNFYDLDPGNQRRESARRLFRYLKDYVLPFHPYLRKFYREQNIDIASLRRPEDIVRLPLIDKTHLQSDPLAFILRPAMPGGPAPAPGFETEPLPRTMLARYALQALWNRPAEYSDLVRDPSFRDRVRRKALREWFPIHTHFSAGSCGTPTPSVYTHYDLTTVVRELASILPIPKRSVRDPEGAYFDWTDRTLSVFPGAPHVAYYAPLLGKILTGAAVLETFGGAVVPTDRQIEIFQKGGFTRILAVPSYLVKWLRRAIELQEQGLAGPLPNLRAVLLGAEPVSEPLRGYIHSLGARLNVHPRFRVLQTYGSTELRWTAPECAEQSGCHLNPKYFYPELLHPETREPVAEGEPGVLVFSHIGWRGTVLIRFWTGDLVKGGMTWSRCPHCGYAFPRIHPPVCRADKDFTKLRGTRLDLSHLVEVVRDTPGVRLFQISLENEAPADAFSREMMVIRVAPDNGQSFEPLERQLRERVKHFTELTPDRVLLQTDEPELERILFARSQVKAEYLVDRRASAAQSDAGGPAGA